MSETEALQMAVMQEGARRSHATVTRTKRRSNAPKAAESEARNEIGLIR